MKMDGREEEGVKERKERKRRRTGRGENRKKRGWRGVGITVLPRVVLYTTESAFITVN